MVVRVLFGWGLALVGGLLVLVGLTKLRNVYHVVAGDPLPVRDLQGREGPVEIAGVPQADDDATVEAPYTGTDCLAYEYEVEEYRSSGKRSSWKTIAERDRGADVPRLRHRRARDRATGRHRHGPTTRRRGRPPRVRRPRAHPVGHSRR